MTKFAVFIAVAYLSSVDGTYLNSLTAADSILAIVNGDYTPKKVYFPNFYSHDKFWNEEHTSYHITQEVNCVNGSVYFTDFQRSGFPEMDGDLSNTYLRFTVDVGQLQVAFASCDGITTDSPTTLTPTTQAPTEAPTPTTTAAPTAAPTPAPTAAPIPVPVSPPKLAVYAAKAPKAPVSDAPTTAGPAPGTTQPPSAPGREGPMRSTFPYTTKLEVTVGLQASSDSCTTWVQSIKPDLFSWDPTGYWNDVFDQIQQNMKSTFQYELKPIFQSALSETDICYLLN